MNSVADTASRVHVVVPARNEEHALPGVLEELVGNAGTIVVVDNGSVDRTGAVARALGALVVSEPRVGYGTACLAGIAALAHVPDDDVIAFFDADGSDDPVLLEKLVEPILCDEADLVLASRTLVPAEPGALTAAQRLGNRLACALVSRFWGVKYTDLAPCRALRLGVLRHLGVRDPDFGWTIEMQIRAARQRLRIVEIPSRYRRRRAGKSKVSGTALGSLRAGTTILRVISRELWRQGREGDGIGGHARG